MSAFFGQSGLTRMLICGKLSFVSENVWSYVEGCLRGRKGPPAKRLREDFLPPRVQIPPLPPFISHAPVAQLDRVFDYESKGHRFESCRARHWKSKGYCFIRISTLFLSVFLLKHLLTNDENMIC